MALDEAEPLVIKHGTDTAQVNSIGSPTSVVRGHERIQRDDAARFKRYTLADVRSRFNEEIWLESFNQAID
jgi:hypothetical protein